VEGIHLEFTAARLPARRPGQEAFATVAIMSVGGDPELASTDTPPETAAAYLTNDVPIARPDDLVGAVRDAMIGRCFTSATDVAVCEGEELVGLVTIEVLLGADTDRRMSAVMDDTPPIVAPSDDREIAAGRMVRQNESSLAVIDAEGRFVGLIPPQRMLAVLLEEHDEDIARFAGVIHERSQARETSFEPVWRRFRHRLPWLLVGLVGAMVSVGIVASYEEALTRTVMLGFFLPGVVYMADAVGTQTEALVIRGLSVGVSIREVLVREVVTGALIGAAVTLLFIPASLVICGDAKVAVSVGLALLAACSTATAVAISLPYVLSRLGRDPAFGSGPLATVIQDLLSIVLYFVIATAIL
jgi:magnesium transporter